MADLAWKLTLTRNVEALEARPVTDPVRAHAAAAHQAQLNPANTSGPLGWWDDADPFSSLWWGGAAAIKLAGGYDTAQGLRSRLNAVRTETVSAVGTLGTVKVREDGAAPVNTVEPPSFAERIGTALLTFGGTPLGLVAGGGTTSPDVAWSGGLGFGEGIKEGAQDVKAGALEALDLGLDALPWIALGLVGLGVVLVVVRR